MGIYKLWHRIMPRFLQAALSVACMATDVSGVMKNDRHYGPWNGGYDANTSCFDDEGVMVISGCGSICTPSPIDTVQDCPKQNSAAIIHFLRAPGKKSGPGSCLLECTSDSECESGSWCQL